MTEVSTEYSVISLDFNQKEPNILKDYIKNTFKGEFFFIDGNDYTDMLKSVRIQNENDDLITLQNQAITKTIKTFIDSTITKINDQKKKNLKTIENPKPTPKNAKEKQNQTPPPPVVHEVYFQGQAEVIFCLLHWPLTDVQYKLLEDMDVHIAAFFNIQSKPESNNEENQSETENNKNKKDTKEKLQTTNQQATQSTQQLLKLNTIPYAKLMQKLSPDTQTPLRWEFIRTVCDDKIPFVNLDVEGEAPLQWYTLQMEIGRILKFNKFFSDVKLDFTVIPVINQDVGMVEYNYALIENPNNFVNALFTQLKENNWENIAETMDPDDIMQIEEMLCDSEDKTPFPHQYEKLRTKPQIEVLEQNNLVPFIKKIQDWKLNPEKSENALKAATLFSSIEGFNTAAGQQFDLMIQRLNKQFQFGLPVSFYDWSKWGRMTNKDSDFEHLKECILKSNVVEVAQDENTGVLYVLALPPAQKQSGRSVIHHFMPLSLQNASEYYNHIYDTEPSEKKARSLPTPSHVLKSKDGDHDPAQMFLPYADILENPQKLYKLPITYNLSADYTSPYLLPSGTEVDVIRNVWNKKINFEYKVHTRKDIYAQANGDSLTVDTHGIRIFHFLSNNTTFVYKESTFFYQKGKLTIKTPKDDEIILTTSGDIVIKTGFYLFTCTQKGTVGLKTVNQENFFFSNAEGTSYCKISKEQIEQQNKRINAKSRSRRSRRNIVVTEEERPYEPIQKMHKSTDPLTKIITLIREDGVDYTINNKEKKRTIKFNNITAIQENDNSLSKYTLNSADIPTLSIDNQGVISFTLGDYNVIIKNETILFTREEETEKIQLTFTPENLSISAGDLFILDSNSIQVKSNQTAFIANSKGDERMAVLATTEPPPKKRPEYLQTNWGLLPPVKDVLGEAVLNEQQRIFPPHYFAIRRDLSVTEFIFTELTFIKDTEQFHNKATIDGKNVEFISFVEPETQNVTTYIDFFPYDKPKRTATMKEISAIRGKKKLKKGEQPPDLNAIAKETEEKLNDMNEFFRKVTQEIEVASQKALEEFRNNHKPAPPPPPDVDRIPPQTPAPDILIAARRAHLNTVDPHDINFWDSPEAEFIHVTDVTIHKPRPPSSRTKLFDPPRHFQTTEKDIPPLDIDEIETEQESEHVHIFETSITPRQKYAKARTGRLGTATTPSTARSAENRETNGRRSSKVQIMKKEDHDQKVDFGDVPVNKGAHAILQITNTSPKPFKYTLLQPDCKAVKILTPPGVVQAGFKLKIKVSLFATEVGQISTSFRLVTPSIDMEIPVFANIIGE